MSSTIIDGLRAMARVDELTLASELDVIEQLERALEQCTDGTSRAVTRLALDRARASYRLTEDFCRRRRALATEIEQHAREESSR